jgi:hypothetical protein
MYLRVHGIGSRFSSNPECHPGASCDEIFGPAAIVLNIAATWRPDAKVN